ncbi:hypothetical protein ACE6ED_21690 [Paenibacillus sp. CN-4]|uniref:hypothetical protein n=1 Tax=Paenibacillus nanchangensis TaxID=3348343 RepID=UPI0039787E7B
MTPRKDRLSLLSLIIAILLINIFGNSLDSLIWQHFSLLMNCILAQAVFLQLSNIVSLSKRRSLHFTFNLLALLAGLIAFVVILFSPMGLLNRIFFIVVQFAVSYAEVIQLKNAVKKS